MEAQLRYRKDLGSDNVKARLGTVPKKYSPPKKSVEPPPAPSPKSPSKPPIPSAECRWN
jgi:hypothetical protein